jgi:chromosome segregation ATPase
MTMNDEANAGHGLMLDQKTIDVLVANIIPTSKYFETRFDHLQYQVNEIKTDIKDLDKKIEARFSSFQSDVDKRFEQVDKRFEQVDKRFEQVDKRFQQIDDKLDKILERIDRRIDEGLRENRSQIMRMFTFAMTFSAISMIGLVGKMFKLF